MKHKLTLNDEQMRIIHAALVEYRRELNKLDGLDKDVQQEIKTTGDLIRDTDI